jgi:hypothetical protein
MINDESYLDIIQSVSFLNACHSLSLPSPLCSFHIASLFFPFMTPQTVPGSHLCSVLVQYLRALNNFGFPVLVAHISSPHIHAFN